MFRIVCYFFRTIRLQKNISWVGFFANFMRIYRIYFLFVEKLGNCIPMDKKITYFLRIIRDFLYIKKKLSRRIKLNSRKIREFYSYFAENCSNSCINIHLFLKRCFRFLQNRKQFLKFKNINTTKCIIFHICIFINKMKR